MHEEQITLLQAMLQNHAKSETRVWWENYVKESAPFIGVRMPLIRSLVQQWHREHVAGRLDLPEQVDLALALFAEAHTEEKLAGTLFLQEILLPVGAVICTHDIERFAALFDSGNIYDWNTCDWFCVKVLGPLIQANGVACANQIAGWRSAENLWRARAALVAFVNVASERRYYPAIEVSCGTLIRRPERFAKTAVGWILRDISRYDEAFVRAILEQNIQHFSAESLKNATKYFGKETQKQYRDMRRHA